MNSEHTIKNITGVILAGGRAKRMAGQDKGLLKINNKPMIESIIEKLIPQVNNIVINANRNKEQYQQFNYQVISDDNSNKYNGPLAGMLSAMNVSEDSETDYILTVPCDSPFFPSDLSKRLLKQLINNDAEICVVHDGMRMQPVFALIKINLKDSLNEYLDSGERKIDLWYKKHNTVLADLSDYKNISMNINTPEELVKIEQQFIEIKQIC